MFPGGSPFGFYNAPVSKALFIITGATSAINILFSAFKFPNLLSLSSFGPLRFIQDSKILTGLFRALCYSSGKNLFFGSLLVYNFRIFEHRYGSQKFASYILVSSFIGAGFQYAVVMMTHRIRIDEIPGGPFCLIFSLYVPFYFSIPSMRSPTLFGLLPSTEKFLAYVMGLQMLLTGRGEFLSGLSGVLAGLVYHFNLLCVQRWLRLPDSVNRFCTRLLGNVFGSTAPANAERPQGATLEVQRQLRMDEIDQQMWRFRDTNIRRRRPASENPNLGMAASSFPTTTRSADGAQQPTTEVSEEQVQRLVEMGFSRHAVLQALTASNNNMAMAMNILLAE